MKISIAFYKKTDSWLHKLVSRWSQSPYVHAELILPDSETWVGISPFLASKVSARLKKDTIPEDWDFINFDVTQQQYETILDFYNETKGCRYDWIGMILSQFLPCRIKYRNRWYCSEWIAYALRIAGIFDWKVVKIYDRHDLSPGMLHKIAMQQACLSELEKLKEDKLVNTEWLI